jgi:hypothetical protein
VFGRLTKAEQKSVRKSIDKYLKSMQKVEYPRPIH